MRVKNTIEIINFQLPDWETTGGKPITHKTSHDRQDQSQKELTYLKLEPLRPENKNTVI